jgi:triosephosphate isomerase
MPLRRIIAGNWKMNGLQAEGMALARGVVAATAGGGGVSAEIVICPPFTLLAPVAAALRGTALSLGAQDCHEKPSGAYTGSIAAPMLAELGCRYVIVGHSERRHGLGETDAMVNAKLRAVWQAALVPILCLGESLEERDAGRAHEVVTRQLGRSLADGTAPVVLAYEPVWAIGTGRVASEADVAAMHRLLRDLLRERRGDGGEIPILYGGSAKAENAAALLATPEVGGLLVGGASLDAGQFAAIARVAG